MVTAVKRGCGLTKIDAMMTVAELKTLRSDVGSEEFERRVGMHCKELFELNENGFFDGFEFIKSELYEDAIVGDDMRDVIFYRCAKRDDGYEYNIAVSFDGSVMFGIKLMNIFKGARFGDKFVTENGEVLIYGRQTDSVYGGGDMGVHVLMGKRSVYEVYDNGEYFKGWTPQLDADVVGRLSDEDFDIVKAYVKKELSDKDVDGYMQGFIDGYNNSVIL